MSPGQVGASAHTLRITLLLNFYNVVPPHQKYFVFLLFLLHFIYYFMLIYILLYYLLLIIYLFIIL